jgi:hypothetical protein
MWEIGRPNLIWRWAPCGALALGAVAFASFVTFAIPDHIGDGAPKVEGGSLYASTLTPRTTNVTDPSSGAREPSHTPAAPPAPRAAPITPVPSVFPKRGFSPPLERVETASAAAPQPVLRQPELNVPPTMPVEAAPTPPAVPVPPPPGAPAPPQPELVPQATPAPSAEPVPTSSASVATPAPSAEPPTAANRP